MGNGKKAYKNPVACPVCGKVFAEWERVKGLAIIKKWCPGCKAFRYITKKG